MIWATFPITFDITYVFKIAIWVYEIEPIETERLDTFISAQR
jgi:hypothetical protein